LVGLTNKLNLKGQLSEVLTNVALVFATMCTIGLADNQNMLSWGTYLYSCLIVLIVSFVLANFIPSEAQQKAGLGIWLSRIMVVLFALFIGFDVEVLKQHAKVCKSPDYVNESLNLYLDVINLFSGISGSE
jgi:FtsH-binding integral membrane protein